MEKENVEHVEEVQVQDVVQQEKPEKKRMNIVLFTILMLAIFLVVTEVVIYGYGAEFIYDSVVNFPQGRLVITEAILASMVLIVMLLFKNSYVFTQKKEPIKKGIFYGRFYVIGIVLFTIMYGSMAIGSASIHSLFNVFVGALLVGICEEFLCRGWLLNEFLERYGDTKKGVWYSIILSGIIFGLIHLGNFFNGQALATTITQVLNASATGIIWGLIYYKTKNIWSVIILHGLWDFSLFLGELSPVTQNTEVFSQFSIVGIVFTIFMVLCELLAIVPFIKDIDAEPETKKVKKYSNIGFALYFVCLIIGGLANLKMGDEYKYEEIKLEQFAVTKDNYSEYSINHKKEYVEQVTDELGLLDNVTRVEEYKFKYSSNKNNVIIENIDTKEKIEIECEYLVDFIVIEEDNYFLLAYEDYQGNSNPFLYYTYINKEDLSNEKGYLEKVKNSFKKFLLPECLELVIVSDYSTDKKYVTAYGADYGYYLLTEENKVSRLVK